MKQGRLRIIITFLIASGLGVGLHFLYGRLPGPLTALISPVRESLWEHLKLLFLPLLLSGLFLGKRRGLTAWLCSLLVVCALMLLIGWLYNVVFRGTADSFNIILYFVLMALGFRLPRILWPLLEWPGVGAVCVLLTVLLAVLMAIFTFSPPNSVLFADLSGGINTWLTIPV